MRTEEATVWSRLSAVTRFETPVGVSNAIGRHRDPQDLFSAWCGMRSVVPSLIITGVSIRDDKWNTFQRHSVDAETGEVIPPDPELAMEESDAWRAYRIKSL